MYIHKCEIVSTKEKVPLSEVPSTLSVLLLYRDIPVSWDKGGT